MGYLGEEIDKLGFGLMRLPRLADGAADVDLICEMADEFLASGFTYFDTAWIYGDSEEVTGKALVRRHPRDSYQLATKGIAWLGPKNAAEAQGQLYESLERTGAGYFDFYLMHMTGGPRTRVFDDFGMWDFVEEKKAEGVIRHVGFSHHGTADFRRRRRRPGTPPRRPRFGRRPRRKRPRTARCMLDSTWPRGSGREGGRLRECPRRSSGGLLPDKRNL